MRRQRKIKQRRRVVVSRWNGMKIWMRKFRVFFCFTLFHSSMILIVIPEKKNETRFYSMSSSDSSPDFLLKFSKLDVRVTCNVCSMMVMKLEVTSELINHRTVLSVSEMLLTTLQARRNRFFSVIIRIHSRNEGKEEKWILYFVRAKQVSGNERVARKGEWKIYRHVNRTEEKAAFSNEAEYHWQERKNCQWENPKPLLK